MGNSQRFIEKWERDRQKGKAKYIMNNGIKFTITYWILLCLIIAVEGNDFNHITKYMQFFIGSFIAYLIGVHIAWKRNEGKYNQLINK